MLAEAIEEWPLAPIIMALQALRGIKLIAAVTLVAEISDLHRFDSPKQLMAWIGLVPAEYFSGKRIKRDEITRADNAAARSMLIEPAWHYRFPAREGQGVVCGRGRNPTLSRGHAFRSS